MKLQYLVQICTVLHESLLALISGLEPILMYLKAGTEVGMKRDGYTMQISVIFTALDLVIFFFSTRYIGAAVTCFLTGRLPWVSERRGRQWAACSQQAHRPVPAASPLHAGKVAGLQQTSAAFHTV